MSALTEIAVYLIQTLAYFYLLLVLLRFLLQQLRADFYNPISQFIVKATNPALLPLRRVIPGLFGIDVSSLVLALLVQWLALQLLVLLAGGGLVNPLSVIIWSIIGLISLTLNIFFWSLIIMVIASWVAPHNSNPILLLVRQLAEPVCEPFRRLIPPMGGLDISIIFVFISINVLQIILSHLAQATQLPARLVLGI